MKTREDRSAGAAASGLCARCLHVRAQRTTRGAVFYRCARADEDDRFMRYPPIPVLRCPGFEAEHAGRGDDQSE